MKKSGNLPLKRPKNKLTIFPEFLLLLVMASILILMVFINDIVTYVGFKELQGNLLNINQENSKRDFLSMAAKYKLQKRLYENNIDDSHFTIEELKINKIVSNNIGTVERITDRYEKFLPPAIFFINLIRFSMRKKPLSINKRDYTNKYLEVAYCYERNKLFKNALEIYDKAMISVSKESDKVTIIQLHQGFCLSIIGNYEEARKKYTDVITENRNDEVTETAKILLSYINELQKEIKIVKESGANSIEKGEKLFKLMAYNDAIELLDEVVPENQEDLEKTQYYKARSMEENGGIKKSVEIYQDIITQDENSEYAKLSNRRILSISTTNEDNKELKELADKNNEKIKDNQYSDFVKLLNTAAGETRTPSVKNILKDTDPDDKITEILLNENMALEKEKNDFIKDIVETVVKEDKPYTLKNSIFYEQAINKLEDVKQDLEVKNAALEKDKRLIENRLKKLKDLEIVNSALKRDKRLIESQLKKLKDLENENKALEKDKRLIQELEVKNAELEKDKKLIEKQLNVLLETQEKNIREGRTSGPESDIVTNTDQFGRIISKYIYKEDEAGNKSIDTYSIYYYLESNKLYKVIDYDGNNKLKAYYLILYNEQDEQLKIKKYDANNNLIYVK